MSGARILLVEDDEVLCDLVKRNLEAREHEVSVAEDAHAALAFLRATSFDLIVLDPPSFTHSRDALAKALSGYKEIHLRALKLIRPGGLLMTFTCSYYVERSRLQPASWSGYGYGLPFGCRASPALCWSRSWRSSGHSHFTNNAPEGGRGALTFFLEASLIF